MSRELSLNILEDVLYRKKTLSKAFSDCVSHFDVLPKDRSFAFQLSMTSLRRLGQIDDLISQCLAKPLPKKASRARSILRLGVAQLMFLNTPSHAAINTSVDLAANRKLGPYKNLINAVLRRIDREGTAIISTQDSAKLNTPKWLWNSWVSTYGEVASYNIAKTHESQPPLDLSIKANPKEWAVKLSGKIIPTGSVRLYDYKLIESLSGYWSGEWWVQDVAASLPVKLLGNLRGIRVADLCSAPGGKAAQLAAAGADVVAIDRSAKRLKILKQNLERLNLDVTILNTDVLNWRPNEPLDAVILDAPCSGTGTIRRHPDVQLLKTPQDVIQGSEVQRILLRRATEFVKPGGIIIYATCSIQAEEGPKLIDEFLGSGAPVFRRPVKGEEIGGLHEIVTPDGDIRTLPYHLAALGGMDGFYVARLVRA